jgi:hydrogenase maturation factor
MTADHCEVTDGCITCGDIAVALTVIEIHGADALCRDDEGRTEDVATELVDCVVIGDRLLVHAGVALERLSTVER